MLPAGQAWWRRRLGGWTWLYLVLTVGSSISAIFEAGAHPWQRVLVAAFIPAVVWGVLVRRERPFVLLVVALAMVATATVRMAVMALLPSCVLPEPYCSKNIYLVR